MIGWSVAWKCFVACLLLLESQQPTCPQMRQIRRCTHVSPVFRQSSQPCALGVTSLIWSRCVQAIAIVLLLRQSTDRSYPSYLTPVGSAVRPGTEDERGDVAISMYQALITKSFSQE